MHHVVAHDVLFELAISDRAVILKPGEKQACRPLTLLMLPSPRKACTPMRGKPKTYVSEFISLAPRRLFGKVWEEMGRLYKSQLRK